MKSSEFISEGHRNDYGERNIELFDITHEEWREQVWSIYPDATCNNNTIHDDDGYVIEDHAIDDAHIGNWIAYKNNDRDPIHGEGFIE